jgi:hypothetical protein
LVNETVSDQVANVSLHLQVMEVCAGGEVLSSCKPFVLKKLQFSSTSWEIFSCSGHFASEITLQMLWAAKVVGAGSALRFEGIAFSFWTWKHAKWW